MDSNSVGIVEKRKNIRYYTHSGAYAILIANGRQRIGAVMDVGLGGLTCSYFADEQVPVGTMEIELFHAKNAYRSERIPCETVFEFVMTPPQSFSLIPMKRQGLKFINPTPAQQNQLETFISFYASPVQ